MLTDAALDDALTILGDLLRDRGVEVELVAIGGGALLLLGLLERPTKDLDIVALVVNDEWRTAKPFPEGLDEAIADVASALDLEGNWLNPGPTSMLDSGLPEGCVDRVSTKEYATLTLHIASREDHVAFKLYAAADHWPHRSKHLEDLERLQPTTGELEAAASWCISHDPSEGFRERQLQPVLREFGLEETPDVDE